VFSTEKTSFFDDYTNPLRLSVQVYGGKLLNIAHLAEASDYYSRAFGPMLFP